MLLAGQQVLVTGATGFLGGALALRLAQAGVKVRALARHPAKGPFLSHVPHITVVEGDITDLERMRAVTAECAVVFHVAAALGGSLQQQHLINVDGTRNVMLAAAQATVKRVVHVSSIAVYGYKYHGDITEDFAHRVERTPYNITKSQAETVVRELGAQYNLSYSIIRPGMIYGPRSNGWTATMFKLGKLRPTPFLGNGYGNAHPIFVDDVIDLMLLLATHPDAAGEAFNCSSDPAPSWRDFLGGYSRLAGHNRWLGIPPSLVRPLAPLIERALTLRGEPQELPALIDFLQSKKTYKMTKAKSLLGWQPKIPLQEGIDRCVPWLKEQGLLS